jgi:hypothetical protein
MQRSTREHSKIPHMWPVCRQEREDKPRPVRAAAMLTLSFSPVSATGSDNPAGPAVPRVQSQPSFKDFIPEESEPQPTEQRSRTPDLLSTTAEPRGLAQTASSLRSSFASLFAPSGRQPTLFPRPRSEEDFKRPAEEAPESAAERSEASIVENTRSLQTSQTSQTSQLASAAFPSPPTLPGLPPPTFRPSTNTIPLAVQNSSTATTACYPRSPFVPVTINPVETSKPPPTKPVETTKPPSTKFVEPPKPPAAEPAETSKPFQTKPAPPVKPVPSNAAAVLRFSSVEEGPKADASKGPVSKPTNPPIWSRPRPQNATIDLNPSMPSFTFPSSQRNPPQPNGAAHAPSLVLGSHPPVTQSAVSKPRDSKPQVSNPKSSKSEEEGVVVGPRRDQARSPRRRPKSPVLEPRSSPASVVPLTTDSNPTSLRPISTRPSQPRGSLSTVDAPDRRRSLSSSNSSLHSNGDEKTEGAANGSLNPVSDGLPQRDASRLTPSDGPPAATYSTAKPSVKPSAKRSLLQSALAPPNPRPAFRSSFTSTSETDAPPRETDAETPPSRRSFALPSAEPASFDPASSSRRYLGTENGRESSSRLLRLPSMPTVNEGAPSAERDRADGGDFASLEQVSGLSGFLRSVAQLDWTRYSSCCSI